MSLTADGSVSVNASVGAARAGRTRPCARNASITFSSSRHPSDPPGRARVISASRAGSMSASTAGRADTIGPADRSTSSSRPVVSARAARIEISSSPPRRFSTAFTVKSPLSEVLR